MHYHAADVLGKNRFKLGLFGLNTEGGLAATKVKERWPADWADIAKVAKIADRAGFEFLLPIARWKGYKGETNPRGRSFETFTQASALAALTKQIVVFATVHVPFIHPIFAAKALATIDHVSSGRAGINIVSGWNQPEFEMFGFSTPQDRYVYAKEWMEIFSKALRGERFDHKGKIFNLKNVEQFPGLVKHAEPIRMSASFSKEGRSFATQYCDFLFTTFPDVARGLLQLQDIQSRAKSVEREISVFTTCHIVCRPTNKEAQEYYHYYAVENADQGAVDYYMEINQKFGPSHDPSVYEENKRRFAGGLGTYPLIGSPDSIVKQLAELSKIGFSGTSLSFVNFKKELPFFIQEVLPRMEKAKLRNK